MSLLVVFILTVSAIIVQSENAEFSCSPYDYAINTLRTVIKQEMEMEKFELRMQEWGKQLETTLKKYSQIEEKLENKVEELLSAFAAQQKDITQKTEAMQLQFKTVEQQLKEDTSSIALSSINSTMETFLEQQAAKAPNKSQQIAFTAHTPTGTLVDQSPTFRTIVMNLGDGYNTSTGRFTAPVSGLYSFSVTLFASYSRTGSQSVSCDVRRNSAQVARVYTNEGRYDSASVSAHIHLSVGDIADLSCYRWNYIYTGAETSFTGALIRTD